jgi:hypothetical protein
MLNLNINSKDIADIAQAYNCAPYTAMAILAAKDCDITESEMPEYLKLFHENMERSFGFEKAIHEALCGIILNPSFMDKVVKKCVASQPGPLQSAYNFSLN